MREMQVAENVRLVRRDFDQASRVVFSLGLRAEIDSVVLQRPSTKCVKLFDEYLGDYQTASLRCGRYVAQEHFDVGNGFLTRDRDFVQLCGSGATGKSWPKVLNWLEISVTDFRRQLGSRTAELL